MNGSMKGWKGTDQVKNLSEKFPTFGRPFFHFLSPFPSSPPFFSFLGLRNWRFEKIYTYICVCMRVNVIYLSYACVHARIVTGMNRSGWRGECRPIRKGVVLNHVFFRSIPHFHSANVSRRVVTFKEKKKKKSRSNRFFFP